MLILNDNAPVQLGMCADIPVLTIYCSIVKNLGFYPYNDKSPCISYDDLYCNPCGIHGHDQCPVKTFDCGNKLLLETVISELKEYLREI